MLRSILLALTLACSFMSGCATVRSGPPRTAPAQATPPQTSSMREADPEEIEARFGFAEARQRKGEARKARQSSPSRVDAEPDKVQRPTPRPPETRP